MKLWNIEPVKIKLSFGEIEAVVLGEEGRARRKVIIPFQAKKEDIDSNRYNIGYTRNQYPKIIEGESSDGWIAKLSGGGTYTRGTYGTVYVLVEDKDKVNVLSYGYGAYGDAGRVGSWNDFLASITEFPARFLVRPAGGPGKRKRYWLVFTKDKVYTVKQEETSIFTETTGIDIPDLDLEEGMAPYEKSGIIIDLYNLVKGE